MLKRLKKLGAGQSEMLDVYFKQIRCILEFAVAVWTPGLTSGEDSQIERVQKCALHVILGDRYESYSQSLDELGVEKLSDRRSILCLNFAKRLENHPKYSNWFNPAEEIIPPTMSTRSDKAMLQTKYTPVPFRTDRYGNSPIPFLTEALNNHYSEK